MKNLQNGSILRSSSPLLIQGWHVFLLQASSHSRLHPTLSGETPSEVPLETPICVPLERTPPEFPRETPPVSPRDVPRETPHEQLHQRRPGSTANGFSSYGSRRSRTSRSSKTKLVVAQLKIKKLEEEQRLKTMEHELEKLQLKILLNARVEVKQAQIELSVESGDSSDIGNRPSILPSLPKQTLYETGDRYFVSCENDRPRPASTPLLHPEKILPSRNFSSRSEGLSMPQRYRIF